MTEPAKRRYVPLEPTEAMLEAGEQARRANTDVYMDGSEVAGDIVPAIWTAMLEAALEEDEPPTGDQP